MKRGLAAMPIAIVLFFIRTLSDKDAPEARDVQPPTMGKVVELPQVGGLHHRYERRAA